MAKPCSTCGAVFKPATPPPGPAVLIPTGSAIRFKSNAAARDYHRDRPGYTLILGPDDET